MEAEPRFHTGWMVFQQEATEEPACHPTYPEAAESLKELMRMWADEDDDEALEEVDWDLVSEERELEWLASDEAPAMLATVASVLRDDPPREPENYLAVIEDHQMRKIAFFLIGVMCDDPAHEAGDAS